MADQRKSASPGAGTSGEGGNGSDRTAAGGIVQVDGSLRPRPFDLDDGVRARSVSLLNHVLADSILIRDLYKKHHWQVNGLTAYQLHGLFDEHYAKQVKRVDKLAERVQTLGGVSLATPHDVIEETCIERPPRDIESTRAQLMRLIAAHGVVIGCARSAVDEVIQDHATQDLLISEIIAENEKEVWLLSSLLELQAGAGAEVQRGVVPPAGMVGAPGTPGQRSPSA